MSAMTAEASAQDTTARPEGQRVAGVPAWVLVAVLFIGLFSPYGLIPVAGLRPDHLAIPVIFVLCFLLGWLKWPPPLAVALFGHALLAVFATLFFAPYAGAGPLEAAKNLDGLLRGPLVLMIAASLAVQERGLRLLGRALAVVVTLLLGMALVDRLASDSLLSGILTSAYGGAAYQEGIWAAMGANHRALMLLTQRASAVFVTAPALAMAAVLLLNLALVPGLGLTPRARRGLMIAAVVMGILSNSKSFILGAPIAVALNLTAARLGKLVPALAAASVLGVGLAFFAYGRVVAETGIEPSIGLELLGSLYRLTGGRFGAEGWSVLDVTGTVLNESPVVGYGLGYNPALVYSDSGLNRILLHGGLVTAFIVGSGIVLQWVWFRQHRGLTPWSTLGGNTLVLSLAFFAAGAVFMMPRLNDIVFVLIGTGIAVTRAAARDRRRTTVDGRPVQPGRVSHEGSHQISGV